MRWLSTPKHRAYAQLHLAVLLFGFAAILGKLISLSGTAIVWYRMLFTLVSLCLFPGLLKRVFAIPKPVLIQYGGVGGLMALHWITFFEAIKYSNASVAVSCMAAVAFFTSLIEPIYFKRKIRQGEMWLGVLVMLGIGLIFGFSGEKYALGISLALISALLISLVSVFNKVAVTDHDVYAITAVQFAAGVLLVSLLLPFYYLQFPDLIYLPQTWDWFWLLVLALVGTTFAYTLNMQSLKHLSAYTTMLAMNLEPVYGIILAWIIFREDKELNMGFYIGTSILLLAVFVHPILEKQPNS